MPGEQSEPLLFWKKSIFSNFYISAKPFLFHLPPACCSTGTPPHFYIQDAETGIMLCKAWKFGDHDAVNMLLEPHTPLEAKKIGRRVQGFDESAWETVVEDVARAVVRAKFSADPALKNELLATGDRAIAEASPTDAKWGIGVSARAASAQDPSQWRGRNILGRALEDIRRELRSEACSTLTQIDETLKCEHPVKIARKEDTAPVQPSYIGGWGYVLSAVLDAAAQDDLVAALADVRLLPGKGSPSQSPCVYGGRAAEAGNAALQNVPERLLEALKQAARCLEAIGHTQVAQFVRGAENITVNKYVPRDTFSMHKDPNCYKPCIVALCLGGAREMSFKPKRGHMEIVSLQAGDVYVVEKEGYESWTHGMTRQVRVPCSSVTLRQWKPEARRTRSLG